MTALPVDMNIIVVFSRGISHRPLCAQHLIMDGAPPPPTFELLPRLPLHPGNPYNVHYQQATRYIPSKQAIHSALNMARKRLAKTNVLTTAGKSTSKAKAKTKAKTKARGTTTKGVSTPDSMDPVPDNEQPGPDVNMNVENSSYVP
jgi:hypothetical protein